MAHVTIDSLRREPRRLLLRRDIYCSYKEAQTESTENYAIAARLFGKAH